MAGEAALFVVVLLLGVAATAVLYWLIQDETSTARTMDRSEAEAQARQRSAERYGDDEEW